MTAQKIMLLGEIGVGKSSIAQRLVFNRFGTDYKPTLGVDIYTYEIETPTEANPAATTEFIIWDTDGNFGESVLSHIYIKEAAAALIVGDIGRRTTLMRMLELGNSFMQDLIKSPIPILRTSAKTGENVKNAFLRAADAIRRRGL